jgi:HEAT repeat protein
MNTPAEIPFQQLLDALLDEETPFNPSYLYRLSDLDDDELIEFSRIFPQVPTWRRQALLEDLETLGEQDYLLAFDAIGRLAAQDEDTRVRTAAVRILWEYEDVDLADLFVGMLESDKEPVVRAAAASGLARFIYLGELDELPYGMLQDLEDSLLAAASGDSMPLVRRRAIEALGYSSRQEVTPLIETAYASGEKDWLASALFAMGRSANNQWEERVLSMLDNPHPIVRTEAARAAGELELDEALESLLELLDDPNDDVRLAAIWSLSQIGGEGVRDTLEEMQEEVEDEDELEILEAALDNLSFTEDMELFTLFDIPGAQDILDGDEDELLEIDEDDDFYPLEDQEEIEDEEEE